MKLTSLRECIRAISCELSIRRQLTSQEKKLLTEYRTCTRPSKESLQELHKIAIRFSGQLHDFGYQNVIEAAKNTDYEFIDYVVDFYDKGNRVIAVSSTIELSKKDLQGLSLPARRGKKELCFFATPKTVYALVKAGIEQNFEVSESLRNEFQLIKETKENFKNIAPILDTEIRNTSKSFDDFFEHAACKSIKHNLEYYADRSIRFGLHKLKKISHSSYVTTRIINRESSGVSISHNEGSLRDIINYVYEFNRLPLLVIMQEQTSVADLQELVRLLSNFVDKKDMICLYRDTKKDSDFNKTLQDLDLSNWLHKNTKVVFVSNKMPKLLLKEKWYPLTAISTQSRISNRDLRCFTEHNCDAIIYYEEKTSIVREFTTPATQFYRN